MEEFENMGLACYGNCPLGEKKGALKTLMKTPTMISIMAIAWSCALFPFPSKGEEISPEEIEKRVDFFQQNFSKFIPVQFQKGTNTEAAIRVLKIKENVFEYQGSCYCGFQFALPEWLDGDVEWMYLLAKTEESKKFQARMNFYVIPQTGRAEGFEKFTSVPLFKYPNVKPRFPYTLRATMQTLPQDRLQPGKTYAVWFGFKAQNMPDIAYALTIRSERGEKEFGVLPLR